MSEYTDFLIVGGGISGLDLQYELHRRGKSSICFDLPTENRSSYIAAGIVNPIAGKFFTLSWRANDFFPGLSSYYTILEKQTGASFFHEKPLMRVFSSAGEQNIWLSKAHQARYQPYCEFYPRGIEALNSPFGVLSIKGGGYLDTHLFLSSMRSYLKDKAGFIEEEFDHSQLQLDKRQYKNIRFGNIIFCEGYRAVKNPLFSFVPFTPNKGELLEIEAKDLELNAIAVGGTFILPVGDNRFKVGATYEHHILDTETTSKNRTYLLDRFHKMMKVDYKVVDQWAGIRPAIKDRRPVLGRHPEHDFVYIFNGLGSKGVSMGPQLSYELADHILESAELDPACDIQRFYELV